MKRYKLLADGYRYFKKGEIYEGETSIDGSDIVREILKRYPKDWEEVFEKVETDEEIVNKLVDEYWFSEDDAKVFLDRFKDMEELFNIKITVYQAATFINYFK